MVNHENKLQNPVETQFLSQFHWNMEDLVIRCKEEKCWGRLIKKVITQDDILKYKELNNETEIVQNDLFWVCDNLSEQEGFQENANIKLWT